MRAHTMTTTRYPRYPTRQNSNPPSLLYLLRDVRYDHECFRCAIVNSRPPETSNSQSQKPKTTKRFSLTYITNWNRKILFATCIARFATSSDFRKYFDVKGVLRNRIPSRAEKTRTTRIHTILFPTTALIECSSGSSRIPPQNRSQISRGCKRFCAILDSRAKISLPLICRQCNDASQTARWMMTDG